MKNTYFIHYQNGNILEVIYDPSFD